MLGYVEDMTWRGPSRVGLALAVVLALAAATPVGYGEPQEPVGETRARPARPLDDRALRAVFLDLVGRPPRLSEREVWFGRERAALLDDLVGGVDFWRHWFDEQLYYFLLIDNFRPRTEELLALPEALAAGRASVREAIHRIALSSSFDQRNPGADTFVTVVLEQLDGVEVQRDPRTLEIGKALYDGRPGRFLGQTGDCQSDVVRIAIEDRRFERSLVAREHARWLGAEPAASDLAAEARALRRDPGAFTQLVRGWFLSPAYDARLARELPLENRHFVNALYVDLLDRAPDPDQRRRLRSALDGLSDPLPLRSVFARALLDSGSVPLPEKASIEDPTTWVADQFRRLLGRPATRDELATFVEAFHDPACRVSTVLQALLSHPEYHRR